MRIRKRVGGFGIEICLRVFYGSARCFCIDLKSIEIPASVTEIGVYALTGCFMLESIVFHGTTEQWNAIKKEETWNYITGNHTVICDDGRIENPVSDPL